MPTDRQESLYGATKKADEILAASWSSAFGLHTAGMRFFPVYGPWGRPDSVLWHFCRNITEGRPVRIFGDGTQKRDFTFVSDVVNGILAVISRKVDGSIPFRDRGGCFNIGRGEPVSVLRLLECTERALGMRAVREHLPPQPGISPSREPIWARLRPSGTARQFPPMRVSRCLRSGSEVRESVLWKALSRRG